MAEGFSLIKFDGELSKPATVLIEKISEAVGGLYKPHQIRRVAQAEADAQIIKEESQIEITELHRRAMHRFVTEEAMKQENMESITEKAIPLLSDSSTPQDIEKDWIINFFDKCRIVSDEDMQSLWAKILSGEANSPGSFSKRAVNILGTLEKSDAEYFTSVCRFVCTINERIFPLVFNSEDEIYVNNNVDFGILTHLDNIGLIEFNHLSGFRFLKLPQNAVFSYHDESLTLFLNKPENSEMDVGQVIFSQPGRQLFKVCSPETINGFFEYVTKTLTEKRLVVM